MIYRWGLLTFYKPNFFVWLSYNLGITYSFPSTVGHKKAAGVLFCRAARAQEEDLFREEIIPVNVKLVDKEGNESHAVVLYTNFFFFFENLIVILILVAKLIKTGNINGELRS